MNCQVSDCNNLGEYTVQIHADSMIPATYSGISIQLMLCFQHYVFEAHPWLVYSRLLWEINEHSYFSSLK